MSREKCLKRPFKDSLEDIKERMKEKRNKKWAKLGKTNQVLSTNCKTQTNSSLQLKSFQANNRALALALQEEKAKMKEAQDTILHLKKEYQSLAFQMLVLQRKLNSQQVKEPVETRLSILSKIISKVAQNLLSTADLLGPARDLCSTDLNNKMCPSVLEGDDSSILRQADSLGLPTSVLVSDTIMENEMLGSEIENYTDTNHSSYSVSDSWQTFENTTSVKKTSNTGQSFDFHLDSIEAKLEVVPSDEEDRQFGTVLPKTVSTRRRCSNMKIHEQDLEHSKRADLTTEFCKQGEARLEESLEEGNIENTVPNLSQLNEKINVKQALDRADVLPELNSSVAEPKLKQIQLKNREDSQTRRDVVQKGKLEGTKKSSRTKSKRQRSQAKQHCKEKLDSSAGSSKAYDFQFEENVHLTPFRQNRMNDCDNDIDEEKDTCETETQSSEASDSEENSDDSLYVPYKSISKYRRRSAYKNDRSPVRTRPQSKRAAVHQQQKNNNKETKNTTSNEKMISAVESTAVDSTPMIKKINSQSITVMKVDEEKSYPLPHTTDTASKIGKTEASQTSRLHLCDVTNISSSSGTKRLSHPFFSIEETLGPPNQKRRCTVNVNYKEPSICGKLRRGDPFTDTCFLNSPIFKQKKGPKCNSVKKELLSKYNEAFVGCR